MVHMIPITLTCCGATISMSADNGVACPECGTRFSQDQLETIQMQETLEEPVVDMHRAEKMLGRDHTWINAQREAGRLKAIPPPQGLESLDFVFQLSAIREFARAANLPVKSAQSILWARRQR